MSRHNAFQPVWPPFDDDRFELQPEVRKARRIFRAQKARLRALVEQAIVSETDSVTRRLSQDIAALLHNISGTAAYFDDAEFGNFAGAIERPVRAAFTTQLLRPLGKQIIARMDPAEVRTA